MDNNDSAPIAVPKERKFFEFIARHRIAVLVVGATFIALTFAGVGLYLYHATGTAQIDLSRLEYRGVAKESANQEVKNYKEYPEVGPINSETLAEFESLFEKHVELITSVDAFSGDPMALDALHIESQD